jgi:two-component system nitrogen regulation response regulator NtrX
MNAAAREILIVDDEPDIRSVMSGILSDEGYRTREAAIASEAIAALQTRVPNLIVLDVWLEGSHMDGLQLLSHFRNEFPHVPVVIISGHGNIEMAVAALKKGAYDFIEKPFKADRLLVVIERALEAYALRQENEELRRRTGGQPMLVGQSSVMNQLRQAIARVAPTGSRVLISGRAGSGKEIVARLIHAQSRRADGPFVVLNCATMRPDRLEAELFGAERGPDGTRKIGVLVRAHNGTLLLDEIADMPLETQGKIVRVLQEQTFEREGAKVEVDVRVLASTSEDLKLAIDNATFRKDLFYRLNVVPLDVPPLTSRREDIPQLVQHFMERASATLGLPSRQIGDDAIAALQAYEWPGDVRQVQNVVEWLLIMAGSGNETVIRADMLPPEISANGPSALRGDRGAEIMGLPLRDAREVFEREYLMAQINRFGGNISRTATFVGMERSALHRKLKVLGVHVPERNGRPADA